MNLAKISANGQIIVPVEIRRQLGLKSGDKILFRKKAEWRDHRQQRLSCGYQKSTSCLCWGC